MSNKMDEVQFLQLSTELDQRWRLVQDWIRDYPAAVAQCLIACQEDNANMFIAMSAGSPTHRAMFANHVLLAVKEAEYRRQVALRDED